jgi:flagellar hook-associated protein 2
MKAADVEGTFLQSIGMLNSDNATFKTATAGKNSMFTVNNVEVERSSNTGLSDVLAGVSLNLAGDAEGKTATLSVTTDTSSARNAINAFIAKYNELQTYLKAKTSVTKGADGTYTREALAGDLSLKSLRSELHARFTASATNSGAYANLRQIGIDLDTDLTAKVIDTAKLEDALTNHLSDVQSLMDAAMGNLNSRLSGYSGDKGYAANAKKSAEDQIESVDDRITTLNDQLTRTEERYTQQYAEIQAQLLQMTYLSQQWSSIYSTYSSYS